MSSGQSAASGFYSVGMKETCLFIFLLAGCASGPKAMADRPFVPCYEDSARQALRSEELQKLVKADQDDRQHPVDQINAQWLLSRDETRRKRVGEIFGEGCLKAAKDYAAAALIYQHGNAPDHFFQTYLWAKRAVELGASSQKRLMAMGIDRYLVSTGHKQLFATQASTSSVQKCWCLEEVQEGFSERKRVELAQKSLSDALRWVDTLNEARPECQPAKYCEKKLKNSAQGAVPEFW